MALAGAGQKYLWTKGTTPPPPTGDIVARFDYRIYGILLLLFLLGAR